MKQIRQGVFETNSSSTHSLTICTEEDYNKFINGQLMYDCGELVEPDEDNEELCNIDNFSYDYEIFEEHFTTPSGDNMVAFGYYGHD